MNKQVEELMNKAPALEPPEGITTQWIQNRAVEQYHKFKEMAKAARNGHPNIRLEECKLYGRTWFSIYAKGGKWNKLSNFQRSEIIDLWETEQDRPDYAVIDDTPIDELFK